MSLTRRDFVKLCSGTVAGIGIAQMFHPAVAEAISGSLDGSRPPVIWLQGQGCTGCSVSLLNSVHPSIADVLLKVISLEYHPTVMAWEGASAYRHMLDIASRYSGKFFLVVEGAIPVEADGKYCVIGEIGHEEYTMDRAMNEIGRKAAAVMAVGTCAAYGGIPAAEGGVTGARSVSGFFKEKGIAVPVVNIPGCPPHPDWIVGTLTLALDAISKMGLQKGLAEVVNVLDDEGRPENFYGRNLHENCPYLSKFEEDSLAKSFNDTTKCRYELGCKGPVSSADCFERKWNGGVNWCVENAVCIGCVEADFPDGKSPFYES